MVTVRRALDSDVADIFEVHTQAIREVCRSHYSAPDIEAWAGRLVPAGYLPAVRSREFLVATDDGGVVGFGQLDRGTGEVEALYVHPRALRQGIGRRLLGALEEAARSAGLRSLYLDASLNSVPFYECACFRSERRSTHAFSSGGSVACVRMRKELA